MKKIWVSLAILVFALCAIGKAEAALISFADTILGVDGDTSNWSTGNGTKMISSTYSLLGGDATVTGYRDGQITNLSHRLTRGLGVWGGENDEIDRRGAVERIVFRFTNDYFLNSLELRSLFIENNAERARVRGFLDGSLIGSTTLLGTPSGVAVFTLGAPVLIDRLVFLVPSSGGSQSEFAVAGLDVEPIPEPATMVLLGSGLLGLAAFGRKRRKRSL